MHVSRPCLDDYPDSDLLDYAGMRGEYLEGEDLALAEEAFAELYRRHWDFLNWLIRRNPLSNLLVRVEGDGAVGSFADQVFLQACDRAETYDSEKATVRTWLSSIAKNLLIDRLRPEQRKMQELQRVDQDLVEMPAELSDLSGVGPRYDEEEVTVIRDALEHALTDREWELATAYLEVQAAGEIIGRADPGATKSLAEQLGTSVGNLRATTSRAINKIRDYARSRLPDRVAD